MEKEEKKYPRVTIVMPVYNAEKHLKEAIESILNQTFTDFEFVIINDGSTDQSKEIIISYSSDPRIKYYENDQNIGLIKTLNKGIEIANGEYIARMDADDISFPERLKKQVAYLDKYAEVSIVGTWFLFSDSKEEVKYPNDHESIKVKLLTGNALGHPTVLMRKSDIQRLELRYCVDYPEAEDYHLWTNAVMKGLKMANLPEVLLNYRIHNHQVSNVRASKQNEITKRVILEYWEYFFAKYQLQFSAQLRHLLFGSVFKKTEYINLIRLCSVLIEKNSELAVFDHSKFVDLIYSYQKRVTAVFYTSQNKYKVHYLLLALYDKYFHKFLSPKAKFLFFMRCLNLYG
ncbi:glycosyltransferase [Chitinophagaceae bacterium LB-8]|uniref:Glycosyltransferase n=1 Tax=Paraflavisolibacter caeni TaxID=2982496 RepID=A0A9X2XPM5_9BACT|nr:glycosyltransferase [Paraflavisolibacter caeni]MCU7551294.1 glycosyltransferase [Paraflavisolibacter caeni]